MILSRLTVLACIALALSACSTPASRSTVMPVQGEPASEPVAAAQEDPLVCKTVVPTGTRVAQRTCMRQSELDKARRDSSEMLGEVQRRGVQNNVTQE